jgi:hypothetical protein
MATQASKSRILLITAWAFLLLASGLPGIILQEVFGYEVSFKLASLFGAAVCVDLRFSGDRFDHARWRII